MAREIEIRRIPATPKVPEVVRVAAYARVSADKDAAFHSLEAQTDYYDGYVTSHPDWRLVGIYSDNAISGTVVDRPEFRRMMDDARAGKIDRIITKSITRFARNTVVLLSSIRELKHLGVDVYFEKEDMHSISPDGELLLTLLAMYAEEEARSASENQKWRVQKKFEQGQPWMGKMLGYKLVDGRLEIIPEEAEIVQGIYRDYLAGKSLVRIAKDLNKAGVPARHSDVWNRTSVVYILTNEKYNGSMILQKTYCPDFRTKKRVKNEGKVPKYEVTDSHEAIISLEAFNLVKQKLAENQKKATPRPNEPLLFSGLIRCGNCGSYYCHRNNGTGKYRHFIWTCRRFAELGKDVCPAQAIREDILIAKTKEVLGLDGTSELTREIVTERIAEIIVPSPYHLLYRLKDGTEAEVEWQHKSRRESWTPEMREAARQKTLERYRQENEKKDEQGDESI